MINGLTPILLEDLKSLGSPKVWNFKGNLDNLPSLTPVKGSLSADHQGEFLVVKGFMETSIRLICDRCLAEYSQKLDCNNDESIWIGKTFPDKDEIQSSISLDDIMDFIEPTGKFDPEVWLFEQLHLELPIVKICSKKCPGLETLNKNTSEYLFNSFRLNNVDSRWDQLKKLL